MHTTKCTCAHGRPWYADCLACREEELQERQEKYLATGSPGFLKLHEHLREITR